MSRTDYSNYPTTDLIDYTHTHVRRVNRVDIRMGRREEEEDDKEKKRV